MNIKRSKVNVNDNAFGAVQSYLYRNNTKATAITSCAWRDKSYTVSYLLNIFNVKTSIPVLCTYDLQPSHINFPPQIFLHVWSKSSKKIISVHSYMNTRIKYCAISCLFTYNKCS